MNAWRTSTEYSKPDGFVSLGNGGWVLASEVIGIESTGDGGSRLVVRPSWLPFSSRSPDDLVVEIAKVLNGVKDR